MGEVAFLKLCNTDDQFVSFMKSLLCPNIIDWIVPIFLIGLAICTRKFLKEQASAFKHFVKLITTVRTYFKLWFGVAVVL